jgi:hypothetical protein
VLTNEGKKLTGDSIFYDRVLGYGEAFDNVQMNDTINRNMLTVTLFSIMRSREVHLPLNVQLPLIIRKVTVCLCTVIRCG